MFYVCMIYTHIAKIKVGSTGAANAWSVEREVHERMRHVRLSRFEPGLARLPCANVSRRFDSCAWRQGIPVKCANLWRMQGVMSTVAGKLGRSKKLKPMVSFGSSSGASSNLPSPLRNSRSLALSKLLYELRSKKHAPMC
ncbi:hypothetical protein HPB50_028378 [Hyalomma asiaticum]|nr:hypothetical protein HPB50_028378 [Hyalomma asiaticum]